MACFLIEARSTLSSRDRLYPSCSIRLLRTRHAARQRAFQTDRFRQALRIAAGVDEPLLRDEIQHLFGGGRIVRKKRRIRPPVRSCPKGGRAPCDNTAHRDTVKFGRAGVEIIAAADVHGDRQGNAFDAGNYARGGFTERLARKTSRASVRRSMQNSARSGISGTARPATRAPRMQGPRENAARDIAQLKERVCANLLARARGRRAASIASERNFRLGFSLPASEAISRPASGTHRRFSR